MSVNEFQIHTVYCKACFLLDCLNWLITCESSIMLQSFSLKITNLLAFYHVYGEGSVVCD